MKVSIMQHKLAASAEQCNAKEDSEGSASQESLTEPKPIIV